MARPPRTSKDPSAINTAILLREAYHAIERVVPLYLAERGHSAVRSTHGPVFQHLDAEGTTVSTLAQRAGITKQAMAELVLHLEHHGYVRREPSPTDARAKLVHLTEAGRDVMAIVRGLMPEIEKRLIDEIGNSRWHQLREDLARIPQTFDETTARAADNWP